jgi:hypothetical protein
MPKANSLPTPIPSRPEYRAPEMMTSIPPGCMLFPVMDDRSDPHLRGGEIAVVDTADRGPQHGEVFVIEWSDGRRCIVQLVNRGVGFTDNRKWTAPLTQRESIPGMGQLRMVDGPALRTAYAKP